MVLRLGARRLECAGHVTERAPLVVAGRRHVLSDYRSRGVGVRSPQRVVGRERRIGSALGSSSSAWRRAAPELRQGLRFARSLPRLPSPAGGSFQRAAGVPFPVAVYSGWSVIANPAAAWAPLRLTGGMACNGHPSAGLLCRWAGGVMTPENGGWWLRSSAGPPRTRIGLFSGSFRRERRSPRSEPHSASTGARSGEGLRTWRAATIRSEMPRNRLWVGLRRRCWMAQREKFG